MNKDILDIVRIGARCEAAIDTLTVLKEDYKKQGKLDIPISTIELILDKAKEE